MRARAQCAGNLGICPEAMFGSQDLGFNLDGMFVWDGWSRELFAGGDRRQRRPPAWAPAQLDRRSTALKGNIGVPPPKPRTFQGTSFI